MLYQELKQKGMVISFADFPRCCYEIAGESTQPITDLVIASAKDDALQSFKSYVEYARAKVRNA